MKKQIWKHVDVKNIPTVGKDVMNAAVSIVVEHGDKKLRRKMTVERVGKNTYAGLVLKGSKVTGMFRWNRLLFQSPVFISNLLLNEAGQKCRLVKDQGVVKAIHDKLDEIIAAEPVAA